MEQISQNQTSFIPRKALGREALGRDRPVSFFLVIATLLFVTALLGSGGVFFYKYALGKNITDAAAYLDDQKKALEPETISYLITTDKRLRVANELLEKHIVASPIFSVLENMTLQTVRYSKFEYDYASGNPTIHVLGQAKSYGSVALQADVLNNAKQFVKMAVFSNLNLDDKGNVTFDATISLHPDATAYKKAINRQDTQ